MEPATSSPARAWILLSAGHGPAECALAVAGIAPRLIAEAAALSLEIRELERAPGPAGEGLASIVLELEDMSGETSTIERLVEAWVGTALWVATSPLRPHHRRRNWFIKISRLDPADPGVPALADADLEISVERSGGPGGQNVNKRSTAVRVLHRPSGLAVVAREERSQHQNRRIALERLHALLAAQAAAGRAAGERARWGEHQAIERGNPRRVFRGPGFTDDPRAR